MRSIRNRRALSEIGIVFGLILMAIGVAFLLWAGPVAALLGQGGLSWFPWVMQGGGIVLFIGGILTAWRL